jgi:hypothetical protein
MEPTLVRLVEQVESGAARSAALAADVGGR